MLSVSLTVFFTANTLAASTTTNHLANTLQIISNDAPSTMNTATLKYSTNQYAKHFSQII